MNRLLTMISAVALLTAIAGSAYAQKTVILTSATFKANLGGLTGADDKCQAEADGPASIVPSGTYLAWLSDGTDSPDTRFTKSSHPYVLPDGTKIAENFTDLTDGSILHAINIDPTGKPLGDTKVLDGHKRRWHNRATIRDMHRVEGPFTLSSWNARADKSDDIILVHNAL